LIIDIENVTDFSETEGRAACGRSAKRNPFKLLSLQGF
jgi:hypothetical protein